MGRCLIFTQKNVYGFITIYIANRRIVYTFFSKNNETLINTAKKNSADNCSVIGTLQKKIQEKNVA